MWPPFPLRDWPAGNKGTYPTGKLIDWTTEREWQDCKTEKRLTNWRKKEASLVDSQEMSFLKRNCCRETDKLVAKETTN